MKNNLVYIAIGSNIDPFENIPQALDYLSRECAICCLSAFYRTRPLERPEQDDYLNGVCGVHTEIGARALKYRILRRLEASLGRRRSEDKYAPRAIDLDLLTYNDLVVDEPGLRLPDPDIRTRSFVAVPLLELAPQLCLPDTGEFLQTLVDTMDTSSLTPETAFSEKMKARFTP